MKYLLPIALLILTCCRQPKPTEQRQLYGRIDEIMEQLFQWKRVSYSFSYNAEMIDPTVYTIVIPDDASVNTILEEIEGQTKVRFEKKGNIVYIYEK